MSRCFEKPIPRDFIKEIIRNSWKELTLRIDGGRCYFCKLLWRERIGESFKDCHLGNNWYKFVKDMRLRTGDKVVFKTIIAGLNDLNVSIVRKES
ncbi:DNA-binding barrel domain superfamily [Sesbania bispinosa]|nr:DNA-binding barrel domain superfamily [Sesbania bispinosa]